MKANVIRLISAGDTRALNRLLERDAAVDSTLAQRVAAIVADVRRGKNRALLAYARKFDRLDGAIEITADEIEAGARETPAPVRRAIRAAARNIARVARAQVPRGGRVRVAPGVTIDQRVQPLASVGC